MNIGVGEGCKTAAFETANMRVKIVPPWQAQVVKIAAATGSAAAASGGGAMHSEWQEYWVLTNKNPVLLSCGWALERSGCGGGGSGERMKGKQR